MAHVDTAAFWKQAQELMLQIGDLHKAGQITEEACVELWKSVTAGSYRANVQHLMDSGVIPYNTAVLGGGG